LISSNIRFLPIFLAAYCVSICIVSTFKVIVMSPTHFEIKHYVFVKVCYYQIKILSNVVSFDNGRMFSYKFQRKETFKFLVSYTAFTISLISNGGIRLSIGNVLCAFSAMLMVYNTNCANFLSLHWMEKRLKY
jgi:hypothetical protein